MNGPNRIARQDVFDRIQLIMFTIRQLPEFENWLKGLRDKATRIRLARRLEKAQRGNLGDVSPVGGGVSEMRVHYGPGYRVYFTMHGKELIVLLIGGDKSSQRKDIDKAKLIAAELGKGDSTTTACF